MASPTGISIKGIGLIAAGVLALIFATLITVSIMVSEPAETGQAQEFPDPDEITDIEDTQTGGAMFVTIVDQNDPTRVSSTLRAARFEPIGEGQRRLDEPESWIYLKDGGALRVNADRATMLMPDPNRAPESGTLDGNIVIRAYDSTPAPGEPAPESQAPTLTARFDEPLEFERRYLRMRSAGEFEIESEQVDFSGADLTVIFNDLRDRIELIDVMHGDRMVFHTETFGETASAPESSASPSTPPTTRPDTQPDTQTASTSTDESSGPTTADVSATLQHYKVTLDADVRAEIAGSGHVLADSLELWTTMVDGQIPENAMRRIQLAQDEPASTSSNEPEETASGQLFDAPASEAPAQTDSTPQGSELVIAWSGPMRVRPIDDEIPPELQNDQIALRLSSNPDKNVSMQAPERGFTGQTKQLTYYATRAIAELRGERNDTGIIKLDVENTGTLYAVGLDANLATGLIEMDQRGSITTIDEDPEMVATVRWKDHAEIKFATDEQGALTQRLERARFEGSALAQQAGSSVGARAIDATLDPTLPPESALSQIVLQNGVIASANKETLTGDAVIIDFVPSEEPGGSPQPVRVSSVGSAMGRNPDQMLRAGEMHAQLTRDISGKTIIKAAQASGNVIYRDSKRTNANADSLEADGINEIITLKGDDASVTQAGSTIAGNHITLRAKRRSVEVVGAGTFKHDIALQETADATPGLAGQIDARWSQSMQFEDTLGTIVCRGDVRVISTPDALTRDTLKADRVTINLTPIPTNDPVGGSGAPERELISARASGRAEPGMDPVPASVESRSYAADNPERAVGVLYLEGAQILASNENQTLTVPGSGTLLILDREQGEQPSEENPDAADGPIDGSGLTRFRWQSRMVLDRSVGEGVFTGTVDVDHKSLTSQRIATLQTDKLTARFETEPAVAENGDTDKSQPAVAAASTNALTSAIAEGSVRFLYDGSELLCDMAEYDALADSLFADAIDNNRVTLYRDNGAPPTSARTLLWDLTRDRIEINAPSPVRSTPGG